MKKIKVTVTSIVIILLNAVFAQKIMNTSYADSVSFGETYTDQNIYSRDTQYTIKDSGRFNQPLDRITTSDYTYSLMSIKNRYAYFSIIINISVRDVDSGSKYIFVYNGIESSATLLDSQTINHTLGTTYKSYTITFTNITTANITSDDLIIRYGASGSGENDWNNKNLSVSIVYATNVSRSYSIPSRQTTYDYIRNSEYTITDEGRFAQPLDRITTSDYITPPLEMVGTYMYMNIIVQIDIKEVYDGYQWFCLYNGVNVNSKLISETQFEHYPGEANTSYKTYTLKFDGVPLSMLETNDLVIRYGASGNKSDDWCNKNIKVRIEYVNLNEKLLLNMKYPENISAGETKEYTCYIPDSLNYVVETRGELDTYLIVEGLSTGTVENDNSGVGNNASIGFKGENKWITIKLRCKNSADFGTTEIQIRKQQASLFGFDYGTNDINTTSDLNEPYNNLRTMYDTRRFCEGTESSPSYMLSNDARGYPRLDSEIVFFSGHGKEGLISLPNGRLYSYNLCSMENTKIAVWSACHSSLASATADSILTASIKAGAKAGVGWPDKIPVSSARKFTNKLFSELVGGSTLQNACITAASEISLAIDPILNWKIEGNRQITISKEIPNKLSNSLETAVKINAFNERYTETDDWQVFEFENETRAYKTIDGHITNDFYIIKKNDNNKITDVKHSGIFVDNMQILPIITIGEKADTTTLIDDRNIVLVGTTTYIIYWAVEGTIIPIEINYCEYVDNFECYFLDAICTNLNTGETIAYESIC